MAALLVCALPDAAAQATGTIAGIVTDETGAVLPGATVEVAHTGTTQLRTATTGQDGFYTVPLLQPGTYDVKATLGGFRTFLRPGVTVAVESTARVDMQLVVGRLEESVTVSGQPPLVETSSAQLGTVIDQKKIEELPLNGRNFTQLGTLLPGVVAPPGSLGGGGGDATPGGFGATTSGFNVNGMRNQSNNFLLDGASNNDTFNTGFIMRPPPDAIQEFKILTHSFNAEYGRNAGSIVNVVTRAGSNDLRGAAWEFNRDDALQARNFFAPAAQPKPKLKQNQFGASVGGPILRNRVFGFGYYEGHRNTSGETLNLAVLTDAQREGNFGATPIRDPDTGLPFPGNIIPAGRLDPIAVRLIQEFYPRVNSGPNRYVASPDTTDNRDQFGMRYDYQAGRSHAVLGRYLRTVTDRVTPASTRPVGSQAKAALQDLLLSDTHLFSARAINVARFSYNRIAANPAVTSGLLNADYGINLPHNVPAATGLANIAISGFPALGDPRSRSSSASTRSSSSPTTSPGCAAATPPSSASTCAGSTW